MEPERRCGGSNCVKKGTNRCSGCRTTYYCSAACQKAMWKTHRPDCLYEKLLRETEEHRISLHKMLDPENESGPLLKFSRTKRRCDGCRVQFTHEYGPENECPDCEYMVCESCWCHDTRGSCYCYNKNYGNWYCEMNPGWYHAARGDNGPISFRPYQGDYHPASMSGVKDSDWEPTPRPCNNCGKVTTNLIHNRALVLGSSQWQDEQMFKLISKSKS